MGLFFKEIFRELLKPYLTVIKNEIVSEIDYVQKQIDSNYFKIKIKQSNYIPQEFGECWIEKNLNEEEYICFYTPKGISKTKIILFKPFNEIPK